LKYLAMISFIIMSCIPVHAKDTFEIKKNDIPAPLTENIEPGEESENTQSTRTYWDKSKEGWFWYEKYLEEKKRKEEEKKKETEQEKTKTVKPQEINKKYLDSLTASELRDLGEQAKELAVGSPTRENVFRYAFIQKYMVAKSEQFAKTWQVVLLEHPEISEKENISPSEASRPMYITGLFDEARNNIRDLSETAALLFFYDPECPYCEREEYALKAFEDKNKWHVQKINIKTNPDLAKHFGVEEVPDMWVIYKNPDESPFYYRVRSGYTSTTELEKAISFMYENVILNPEINKNGPGKKEGNEKTQVVSKKTRDPIR